MKYNEGQEKALVAMVNWFKEPPKDLISRLYTLDGAAGVGKTTVIKELVRRLNIPKSTIVVSAPTHAAKKQIELATGLKGNTIQKLYGLRPDVDVERFDINNPKFKALATPLVIGYKVLILDECSMVNRALFTLTLKMAGLYRLKIILIGDSYQLPPIGETMSKVFVAVKNKSSLTEIVRQGKSNPMIKVLQLLRDDIDNGTEYGVEELTTTGFVVKGSEGYRCLAAKANTELGKESFGQAMIKMFTSEEYSRDKKHIRFLAYTNETVIEWSNLLRKRLLGEAVLNVINPHEVLVGYSNVKVGIVDVVVNSEEYKVLITSRSISSFGIKGYTVVMTDDKGYSSNVFIVDHHDEVNLAKFRAEAIPLLDLAMKKKGGYWVKWYAFKNAHLLLVDVGRQANVPVTRWNKLCKKDLYYAYGSTVHKSQGSTYTNTAINLMDLYLNEDRDERARLIYVALSRCKNMNLILVM